ncbi:MAG: SipW-dependent-type signal peptide-containing protein [Oscillospiraceae bacterium]|nr:SipW-dependent-type signal peptide-containing protein [Oscillospiraceae bacterium]
MKKTKKVLALMVAFALVIAATVSVTVAYLKDDDSAKNVFTTGNVTIDLTEAAFKTDETTGNIVEDTEQPRNDLFDNRENEAEEIFDYGKLFPGMTVFKDPTITNTGSEQAYVAAKITVKDGEGDLATILGIEGTDLIDVNQILSGGYVQPTAAQLEDYNGLAPVWGDETYALYQEKVGEDYVFWFFFETPLQPAEYDENGEVVEAAEEVMLFNLITIPTEWGNTEMAQMKELSIEIKAFGVQTFGFDSCFDAMTAAYETEFPFTVAP